MAMSSTVSRPGPSPRVSPRRCAPTNSISMRVMDTAGSLKALPGSCTTARRVAGLVAQAAAVSRPRCRSAPMCNCRSRPARFRSRRFSVGDLAGITIDGKGRVDTQAQRGSISFNLALRDTQGLTALAKTRAGLSRPSRCSARHRLPRPGKLAGTIAVEPAGSAGNSRATISLEGPLGASRSQAEGSARRAMERSRSRPISRSTVRSTQAT